MWLGLGKGLLGERRKARKDMSDKMEDSENKVPKKEDPAETLAKKVRDLRGKSGAEVRDQLSVDDRVLARITDGIYRRPSAALRELIFNAYDADATEVVIDTDAPYFNYVSVRDNGRGMDEKSLSNLFKHIGGSSKRTYKGVDLGTVNKDNPDLSYNGRKLIGKIGIGLFAVTHLTTSFRIITKKAGNDYRLVAEIALKTWTEERLKNPPQEEGKDEYVTGDVRITYEHAEDVASQGTEIILFDLRPQTKKILSSNDFWLAYLEQIETKEIVLDRDKPVFHIGFAKENTGSSTYAIDPELPWESHHEPEERFYQLFSRIADVTGARQKNPDIEEFLDGYLAMIWRLSLAAPIQYVGKHPFEVNDEDDIEVYVIKNKKRSQAELLELERESVSDKMDLEASNSDPCGEFRVFIDGVELKRPVVLNSQLLGNRKRSRAKRPMLFVGKVKSKLGSLSPDLSGGALEFEAYFYWNTLIVPKQNRGVLVRINDASGVLYDDRFMDYQVSELNRLSQITAEIFVIKGMDPALNIDRESFNVSHPHYQYLSSWVHVALRQITNKLKEVGKKGLQEEKTKNIVFSRSLLQEHLHKVWDEKADTIDSIPEVLVSEVADEQRDAELRTDGVYVYHANREKIKKSESVSNLSVNDQVKAVMTVLAAYGLLDNLTYARQQELFNDIFESLMPGEAE